MCNSLPWFTLYISRADVQTAYTLYSLNSACFKVRVLRSNNSRVAYCNYVFIIHRPKVRKSLALYSSSPGCATRLSRGGVYTSKSGAGTLVAASTLRGGVCCPNTPKHWSPVTRSKLKKGENCDVSEYVAELMNKSSVLINQASLLFLNNVIKRKKTQIKEENWLLVIFQSPR